MWTPQAPNSSPPSLHQLRRPTPPFSAASPPTSVSFRSVSADKNQLIQSLSQKGGSLKQAISLLSQEPNPTQHTYEALILACARYNSLQDGLVVHRHLIGDGFGGDCFLATKLITMYSDLGSIDCVHQVFDKMRERTVYVWNALFRALTLAGKGEEVLKLYRKMNRGRKRVHSDGFTYTYVLKACVAMEMSAPLLHRGKEIHANMLRNGYETHVHTMTTLMDMYARFGYVRYAGFVFDEMPVKNLVSWSAMIACYAKNGMAMEALELFGHMMLEEREDLVPNSVTMIGVLQACGSLAALEQGKLIHGYILRKGLDSILPITSALVTMYARCGDIELGRHVFNQMEKRDVVSWNSMIGGYGIHGLAKEAIRTFNEMISEGVSPSPVSYVSALTACSHAGLVEQGKSFFESMVKLDKIKPMVEHYACMVDLLGRANQLDEAAKIIEGMRTDPGKEVWGSLLGACRIHCNVELAERACNRLFKLEPTNAGNYVLLTNIYAEAQMWDEVKRLKKVLENRGLKKVSGRSWIEVKRKIYTFTSVDEFNPQIEQVHALLLELSMEMKERGYVPDAKVVLYDLEEREKERILLGHSEKLAVAFGLINTSRGGTIRITKNLRLCEDCHSVTKFISKFANREIFVRDTNRFHHFKDGECSCRDYW